MNVQPGEIVYCKLTLQVRKIKRTAIVITAPTVFSFPYAGDSTTLDIKDTMHRRILEANKIKESATIVKVEVISRHGFRNKY